MRGLRSRRPTPDSPACVIGTIDLVRPLGLAGVRSAVVAPPGGTATFSRYCCATIDPAGPEPLLDSLLSFARCQGEKPALFYESDKDVSFIARNLGPLGDAFRFVLCSPSLIEDLLDKGRFHKLARRLDLPVPPTWTARPALDDPPSDLCFPAVLKPLPYRDKRWDRALGGRKVGVVGSAGELADQWRALGASDARLLIQELVPGAETEIVSYHAYIDDEGNTVGEFTGQKLRTYPPAYGHSTALTTTDDRTVARAGREILARIGLRGVAKVDFKRGPDGRLRLLEVNPRFSLWAHLGAVAGVNLPALVYADLMGRERPRATAARPGVRWFRLRDRAAARAQGIGGLGWLAFAATCDANSGGISRDDPLGFVRAKVWRLRHGAAGEPPPPEQVPGWTGAR